MEGELYNAQEGLEGELGYKGERGYSTYELAVLNGFEGSLQDYLDHYGVDLSNYVSTSDVVDNLTSTTTNYPLSAKQGKVIDEYITNINNNIGEIENTLNLKANASDVYTKTESDNLLDTKFNVSNIVKVETGKQRFSDDGTNSVSINYPSGFNKENTYVLAVTEYIYFSSSASSPSSVQSLPFFINSDSAAAYTISFYDNNINVWCKNAMNDWRINLKIILMKIEEE